jgi:hypothetical protein
MLIVKGNMKRAILSAGITACLAIAGCGKQTTPPGSTASTNAPAAQPAIAAWQQGDTAAAVSSFVQTDWTQWPLFASDSTLSLSEDQFKALSAAERESRSAELTSQVDAFRRLASAVAEAGRDDAAKGDAAKARKYFASLQLCGTALSGSNCLAIIQLVGKAVKKMGDTEMAKAGQ